LVRPARLIDRSLDSARSDGVDADLLMRDLLGERFHQKLQTALRGGIVRVPRPRNDLVHRAYENDVASGLRSLERRLVAELTNRFLSTQESTSEIDVEDPLPIAQGELGEGSVALNTGIGNENVEPAETLDEGLEHRATRILIRDVRPKCDRTTTFGLDALDDFVGILAARVIVDAHRNASPAQLL